MTERKTDRHRFRAPVELWQLALAVVVTMTPVVVFFARLPSEEKVRQLVGELAPYTRDKPRLDLQLEQLEAWRSQCLREHSSMGSQLQGLQGQLTTVEGLSKKLDQVAADQGEIKATLRVLADRLERTEKPK